MAKLRAAAPIVAAVLIGTVYYVSFRGIPAVATKRNAIAFADSSHYVELLTGRHYATCARSEQVYHVEHRRKTVHHIGYLLFADAVVQVGRVVAPGVTEADLIWLISPLLGTVNFVLAFRLFQLRVGALALPSALTYALIPATWIYAAIPETWMFVGAAVLIALLFRERQAWSWIAAAVIGAMALANLLILLLVLLLQDERRPLVQRGLQILRLGAFAVATWLALLLLLGVTLSPDFLPHRFVELTVSFKARMGENLPVVHPGRWIYTLVNGGLLPFVLNQRDLNFGRYALVDSARTFPLGTAAVIVLVLLSLNTLRDQMGRVRSALRASASWPSQVSGQSIYLAAAFVAAGLALYYESFLYSPLFVPILLGFALQSIVGSPRQAAIAWGIAAVWALNAAQQILFFRSALVG